jgi:Fe(3+) dicitrate transport protein
MLRLNPITRWRSNVFVAGAVALASMVGTRTSAAQTNENQEPVPPSVEEPPPEAPPPEAPPPEAPPPAAGTKPAASNKGVAEPEEEKEVTVVGTRVRHTPGSAHILSSKKLEQKNHDDPQAVLGAVPGVYVRGEDGVGLRPNIGIRGTNPNRSSKVALMEDGVPFAPAPYSASAAYYFPLVTRMVQVRVLKGPATIVYGPQTVGGSVDLVTRSIPASPNGSLDLGLGEYGYGKLHAFYGTSDDTNGFLLEAVHLRNDGFKRLPDDSDTGSYRNEWMVKAAHVFDPLARDKNELRLKATYSEETSYETYLGLSDADFRRDPLQRYGASKLDQMKWNRTAVALTHELAFESKPKLKITTTAYRNDFHRIWRRLKGLRGADLYELLQDPAIDPRLFRVISGRGEDSTGMGGDVLLIGPNERTFVSQGIQTVVSLEPVTGPIAHRIEYGIRLHYDRVERRQSEDGYLVIGGELVPEGGQTVVTEFNEATTESAALYAIDALTWETLTLTPGVRVEFWHSTGTNKTAGREDGGTEQVVLPGVGAYWAILDELGVLAGVYRGFSPPQPPIPVDNPGPVSAREPPGLKEPELSTNYEAGARLNAASARLEVIGFYNDYSNLTDICTQSRGCIDQSLDRQFDAGRAKIYGLEAYAEHEPNLGTLKFPLSASYTLTYAEFLDRIESSDSIWGNVVPGDELPYVPRHQFNGSLGVETERVGGYAALTYVAAMREEAGREPLDEALATDEQLVVDAGARYRVLEPLDIYLNVRNVFDSHALVARRPFGARPNAPRWVQLGAKVKF